MAEKGFHPQNPRRSPGPFPWAKGGMDWVADKGNHSLYIQHTDDGQGFIPHLVHDSGFLFGDRVVGTDEAAWEKARLQGAAILQRLTDPSRHQASRCHG